MALTLENGVQGLHEVHVADAKSTSHGDVHKSLQGDTSDGVACQADDRSDWATRQME